MPAILPGSTVELSVDEAKTLRLETTNETVATNKGPISLRWKAGANNTGATKGLDILVDVVEAFDLILENNFEVSENVEARISLAATHEATWELVAGAGSDDNTRFSIDTTAKELVFSPKNFEAPVDANADNVYTARVRATRITDGETSEAIITATVLNAQATPYTSAQVAALKSSTTDIATGLINTTATQLKTAVNVSAGANQCLVVSYQSMSGTESNVQPIVDVSFKGQALTKIATSEHVDAGNSRRSLIEFFILKNPPPGAGEVIMNWTSKNRLHAEVLVVTDVDVSVDPVVLGTLKSTATVPTYSQSFTVPDDDMLIVGAIAGEVFANGSPYSLRLETGMVETNTVTAIGTSRMGTQFVKPVNTGSTTLGFTGVSNGVDTNSRYAHLLAIAFKGVPHEDRNPHYYIDAVAGNDANLGTQDSPWKTLDNVHTMGTVPPNFKLFLKGGQLHQRSTFVPSPTSPPTAQRGVLDLTSSASVTNATRPQIRSYGGGRAMISGALDYTDGWSAPSSAESNSWASTNAQKRSFAGVEGFNWANFPIIDDKMHHPCIWSPTGTPSAIDTWFESFPGMDSFFFPASNDIQAVAASYDPTKKIRHTKVGANYEVEIQHPDLLTHYGSSGPVGAYVICRRDGNWTQILPITGFQSTADTNGNSSYIKFTMSQAPHPLFFWAVLLHPLDLVKRGTYAYKDNTMYVAWRTGTTKRVSRYNDGISLRGHYWDVDGVDVGGFSGITGDTSFTCALTFFGNNHKYNDMTFRMNVNPEMTNVVGGGARGPSYNAQMSNIRVNESPTHSAFRLRGIYNSTFTNLHIRKCGRTLIYYGDNSNGNVVDNVDASDHNAVHGNVNTNYQDAFNNESKNVGALNSALGITSQITQRTQGVVNPNIPVSKEISLYNFVNSGNRPISTTQGVAYTGSPLARIDGGETSSYYDRTVTVLSAPSGTGLGFYIQEDSAETPTIYYANEGTTITRSVTHSLGFSQKAGGTVKAGQGMIIDNVLALNVVFGGSGLTGSEPWNTFGGAQITGGTELDSTQVWNGSPTDKMWRVLTSNEMGDGYESYSFGATSWNWILPAYGTNFDLLPVGITSDTHLGSFQAGRSVGALIRLMPDTTATVQSGSAADSQFGVDRGVLYAKTTLAPGVYSVPIVQNCTNAMANQTTRTDTLTITIVDP